jgi:predicted nucleotidyltransferase
VTQFDTIFAVLQTTGVRYVVVGGVAVNLHGYQRFTKDVDLVIELVPDRALKSTYAQRLQDLQDMLDFNADAEARNPRLRRIAAQLRRQSAHGIGESQAPGDDV